MASEASASSNTLTEVPSNSSVLQRIKTTATHWQLVKSHAFVTREIREYDYHGAGTEDDPYAVQYIPNDPRDPMLFCMISPPNHSPSRLNYAPFKKRKTIPGSIVIHR